MSRDWLLELGHSRLKLAAWRGGSRIGRVQTMPVASFDEWLAARAVEAEALDDRFWLASVTHAPVTRRLTSRLQRLGAPWNPVATGVVALPVAPAYPELGVDRWLAMQPVWCERRTAFCLVDAGTATTIDAVDADGRHLGGWILPGFDAARAGLLAAAPGLARPSSRRAAQPRPARDTARAIDNGLLLQQVGAIERALTEIRKLVTGDDLQLVLTGGAAGSLQSVLGQASLEPDLVLKGLAMAAERW